MESTLTITSYTRFKQNDLYPILTFELADSDGPIDLSPSGTSVKVFLKGATAGIVPSGGGACTITNANAGQCSYTWQSGDTQTPDTYSVEAHIAFTAGGQTVPNASADNPTITIDPQLDPPTG